MLNYTSNHLSKSVAHVVCIGIAAEQMICIGIADK